MREQKAFQETLFCGGGYLGLQTSENTGDRSYIRWLSTALILAWQASYVSDQDPEL